MSNHIPPMPFVHVFFDTTNLKEWGWAWRIKFPEFAICDFIGFTMDVSKWSMTDRRKFLVTQKFPDRSEVLNSVSDKIGKMCFSWEDVESAITANTRID